MRSWDCRVLIPILEFQEWCVYECTFEKAAVNQIRLRSISSHTFSPLRTSHRTHSLLFPSAALSHSFAALVARALLDLREDEVALVLRGSASSLQGVFARFVSRLQLLAVTSHMYDFKYRHFELMTLWTYSELGGVVRMVDSTISYIQPTLQAECQVTPHCHFHDDYQ